MGPLSHEELPLINCISIRCIMVWSGGAGSWGNIVRCHAIKGLIFVYVIQTSVEEDLNPFSILLLF